MKRRDEVLVGLLLLVSMVVGIFGTIWLVRGGLESGYPLYARFPWGTGLSTGQPVLLAGVTVGYVARAELDPNGTIIVEMRISEDYNIPINSTATVVPVGIFGDQSVALTPLAPSTQHIPEGDTLPVGPGAPGLPELLGRADSIARSASDVAAKFQLEMVQNGGIDDLRATLASTNQLMQQLSGVAAEQSRQLSLTMASIRRSVGAFDSVQLDSIVQNLRGTTANTEQLTSELTATTARLNTLLAAADSGNGTIGLLLRDPALYRDMRGLVARLDSLTADVQRSPRKYINLSIF